MLFYSQADIEKALAIQVDDPIPFMQLLAKSDSGITEVTIIKLPCDYITLSIVFLLVGFFLVLSNLPL